MDVDEARRPGLIKARPVPHPWRWVAIGVIAILFAMLLNLLINNPAFNWPFVFEAMNQKPVIEGFVIGTLLVTFVSMIFAVVGGVILAVMRLSDNPILSAVSWAYTWFFRAIPRYVLLTVMGALGILFPLDRGGVSIGVPFDWLILRLFGIDGTMRIASFDANVLFQGLFGAIVGLAASEAAYMAEIARAGILSVDKGQTEAAEALGMSPRQTTWKVVLPQAMRVIVPPTGNETIAMLKDTSLLLAVPLTTELFFQLKGIGSRTYQIFPVYMAALLYYLAACSVLMVGQSFLERRFGRGFGARSRARQAQQDASNAVAQR
ncbi:amino acid ABC transporter permease [Naumannella cuiyingiana]|uniref:Polar amino acid transport system permease protein n=1 Tax=Naumannella cuiyingiana TaxID=1347891 RepID=A0A7Z0IJP7_9ACTN|nr:amino acid ABC transporter permease [Naumannella cuiyingiana]NYI69738.1 polar amino acid transport system permease protein [Naumannella cuiyingiana]